MKLLAIMDMRAYADGHAKLDQEGGSKLVGGRLLKTIMRVKRHNAREDVRRGRHR